jgi:hypothetical protein
MYCSKSKLNPPRGLVLRPAVTSTTLFPVALLELVRMQRKMEMERLHGCSGGDVDRAMV